VVDAKLIWISGRPLTVRGLVLSVFDKPALQQKSYAVQVGVEATTAKPKSRSCLQYYGGLSLRFPIDSIADSCSERKAEIAFIFDLDGVIIDSMPFHYEAWKESFRSFDISISRDEVYRREGQKREITAKEIYERYKGKYPTKEVVDSIIRTKERVYKSVFEFRMVPDIEDLLKLLKTKKIKLGLTTGSTSLLFDFQYRKDFLNIFDAIVSGEEAMNCKPEPDPYILTIRKLNISPNSCFAIENAPLGILSAVAANLTCFAVKGTSPLIDEELKSAGAHHIYKDIAELKRALVPDCLDKLY
jgi:beta-phosphoglucomutase